MESSPHVLMSYSQKVPDQPIHLKRFNSKNDDLLMIQTPDSQIFSEKQL